MCSILLAGFFAERNSFALNSLTAAAFFLLCWNTNELFSSGFQLSFAVVGGLYWWHLLSPIPSRLRLAGMGPVVYMVGTKIGVGLLGIALTFAKVALYPHYEHVGTPWGLSPHDDQQLAGAVMAVEQSIVMGIVLAWLFARMLTESEREQQRAERFEAAEV